MIIIYTENFQDLLLHQFCYNKGFFIKWKEKFDEELFDEEHRVIFNLANKHIDQYSTVPDRNILKENINQKYVGDKQKNLRVNLKTVLQRISKLSIENNKAYVEDRLLSFIKSSSLKNILPEVFEEVEKDPEKAYKIIEELIFSFRKTDGSNLISFFNKNDIKTRTSVDRTNIDIISTLVPCIDNILKGKGCTRKKLYLISGSYQSGKTTFLVHIGKAAVLQNKNVVFFTMEENKEEIANRFDSSFTGISVNNTDSIPRVLRKKILEVSRQFNGKLFIFEYPQNTLSVSMLEMNIENIEIENNIKIDMVIIDSVDRMKFKKVYKDDKISSSTDLWSDIRSVAQKRDMVIWSNSHLRRAETSDVNQGYKDVATGLGVSWNIEKVNICDFHITLNRGLADSEVEDPSKINPVQNELIYVDKNRMGVRDVIFPLQINMELNSVVYTGKIAYTKLECRKKPKKEDSDKIKTKRKKW